MKQYTQFNTIDVTSGVRNTFTFWVRQVMGVPSRLALPVVNPKTDGAPRSRW